MKIEIKNCNNIDSGEILLEGNKLNIRFGINGTGKSTLAKSIQSKIDDESMLSDLTPFKLRKENPENLKPEVNIPDEIKSVSIFNEDYVRQFLFKSDELVMNSFKVFIETPEYLRKTEEIEKYIEDIKKEFKENEELKNIIFDLKELSSYFKFSKTGKISKSSKGAKSLTGNKIENIPEELKSYKTFLQSENNVSWIDWQSKGNLFSEEVDICPYCTSSILENKDVIKKVSEEYDKNLIKNLSGLIFIIDKLGDYFLEKTGETLKTITKQKDGLLDEQENILNEVKNQIDLLVEKLEKMQNLSFFDFRETEKVNEILDSLKIDIENYFPHLNSEKTKEITDKLNKTLDDVLSKTGKLQGEVNQQKKQISSLIKKYNSQINQFLKNAGYKYFVKIDENDDYKIKLQHVDFDTEISGGEQVLSFGERNAFALVLFMYKALSESPDLIILDDPISSFDKNKKYAILQMLFREDESFKNKTVLMLTHDFEPVIDSVKAMAHKFENQTNATFLENNNGTLSEKKIGKSDIQTFSQICDDVVKNNDISVFIKIIYLRRKFEILNDKGVEYQVLSDLIHKRTKNEAKNFRRGKDSKITDEKFEGDFTKGIQGIKEEIPDFKYDDVLSVVKDNTKLKEIYNNTTSGYEKLQIFRVINGGFTKNDDFSDVMKKFINKTYHIENDFIYQLNPREYNLIPEYIVKECDDYIKNLSSQN